MAEIAHGYDWAWAQISGTDVKSNGGKFVVRYIGGSARLTPIERDNLHADGVLILLVWETAADEAEHSERGYQDAINANAEADFLGYPKDCLILYADDHNDPDAAQEIGYMGGVKGPGGRPSDMYSGGNILVALGSLSAYGGWMVDTWYPNDGADPFMTQLANTREPAMVGVAEAMYDTDLLHRAVPMWGPNGTTYIGGPAPAPVTASKEEEMHVVFGQVFGRIGEIAWLMCGEKRVKEWTSDNGGVSVFGVPNHAVDWLSQPGRGGTKVTFLDPDSMADVASFSPQPRKA